MNIVTIMNYNEKHHNYIKMCKIFIKLVKKYNPDCNLIILYECSIAKSITEYAANFTSISFVKKKSAKDSWSDQHNIRFKLFNLTQLTEPFIFLDSDIFCLSSLEHLWSKRNDQPFIGVNHQHILGHTTKFKFKFLNSGVQIVGDPDWYQFDNFRKTHKKHRGKLNCRGFDQAHIFRYCKDINYDYTHKDIGYGWNSCARYGHVTNIEGEWSCVYKGPKDIDAPKEYTVHLNHYWWDFKPWKINCPIFKNVEM